MNLVRATRVFQKHTYDQVVYGFIFDAVLPTGTTITAVEAAAIVTERGTSPTALLVASPAANVVQFTDDDGNTVGVGRAIQATVSGGTARCTYGVTIKVTASNGEKYGGVFPVEVKA